MKHTLMVAAALAMASSATGPVVETHGYAMPNGWAPSRGNRSHNKPSAASKKAKNRARAKAAAKSQRQQRR